MKVKLEYGKDGLCVKLPKDRLAAILDMNPVPPLSDPDEAVRKALEIPIGSVNLSELARGRKDVCIVTSDITRPVPNKIILPPLLEILEECGISREKITILIGTGIHRPSTDDELVTMFGEEIVNNYRIVSHRSKEKDLLSFLGYTTRNTPIWVNSLFVNSDLKISLSLIEPHLMAGYSGGRKAICPGVSGLETMKILHGPTILEDPKAIEGVIEGNPFHDEALQIARKAGVDFSVNVTINQNRKLTGVFAGELEQAHLAGVRFVEQQVKVAFPEPVEVVLTTSAGYPLDLTFYQAIKGLTGALPVVKEAGTIILAAQCSEGIGSPEFSRLIQEIDDPEEFVALIKQSDFFVVDQWQIEELCKVIRKADVFLFTEGINFEVVENLLVEWAPSVEDAIEVALDRYGPDARLAVIPKGPYILPVMEKSYQTSTRS